MGYVIAAILVLLIVAAGVTFFVLRAARGRNQAAIVEPDRNTPLGDTDQHAGHQTREGTTVDGPEDGGAAGSGSRPPAGTSGSRPPAGSGGVGGEGESGQPVITESERLGDRPR
jgi:hypothetical protein